MRFKNIYFNNMINHGRLPSPYVRDLHCENYLFESITRLDHFIDAYHWIKRSVKSEIYVRYPLYRLNDEEEEENEFIDCPAGYFSFRRKDKCKKSCLSCRWGNYWFHFWMRWRPRLGFCTNCWSRKIHRHERCKKHSDAYEEAHADEMYEESYVDATYYGEDEYSWIDPTF